jgi:phytol kinase
MVLMIAGLFAVLIVFLLLVTSERIQKIERLNAEVTRKFIHITVGSFVAFWPFFMPHWVIYSICIAFVIVIMITRIGGFLPSVHKVPRKTWGDILFPVGIAFTLLIARDAWIFAACILHLSLADGFAALVGEKYGKKNAYKILGYKKTLAGNAAFFAISLLITIWLVYFTPAGFAQLGISALWMIPLLATTLESVAVRGTDNIIVPVILALMLNSLQFLG